jgi:hypothetical protein
MKKQGVLLIFCIAITACRKEKNNTVPPPAGPVMNYTNLQNFEVKQGQHRLINLNGDNKSDFLFNTVLIGDPILRRDRLQFQAVSGISAYVLADPFNNTVVLSIGDAISATAPAGYEWFEAQDILLAEKITPETGATFWQGAWKDISNKYLPLQLRSNNVVYNGWIELSMDKAAERLILHKVAISTEAGKDVKAGY